MKPWYEFVFEYEDGKKHSEIEQTLESAWNLIPYTIHPKAKLVQVKWQDIEMWNPSKPYSPHEFGA